MYGRYLAELEMKLQLLSEDVDAALADSSSRALQRIPVAVQEVSRIKVGGFALQTRSPGAMLDPCSAAACPSRLRQGLFLQGGQCRVRLRQRSADLGACNMGNNAC